MCPICGSQPQLIGTHGRLQYFYCYHCGIEYIQEIETDVLTGSRRREPDVSETLPDTYRTDERE